MLAAPHTSLPTQRELAAHFTAIAKRRRPAGRSSTTTRPAPASRSASTASTLVADLPEIVGIKESSGDFSRFLALRRRYAGRIDGHVRLRRPGGRLLLVGRALAGSPAPRTCCRAITSRSWTPPTRGDHAEAYRHVRRHPAVGPAHGGRLLQPEGEARPGAPGDRLRRACASRCCRSRTPTPPSCCGARRRARRPLTPA